MIGQSLAADQEARRRKVRKGTHSCWECRRRKIRCQYTSADDSVCIGCRARGSACRSQEFADEAPAPVPERKVAQRLDRLEVMMERLMEHVLTKPSRGGDGGGGSSSAASRRGRRSTSLASSLADDSSIAGGSGEAKQQSTNEQTSEHPIMAAIYSDDPTAAIARACPSAIARGGYETRDVLDMSTADDTPVAALLGMVDGVPSGSHDAPAATAATAHSVSNAHSGYSPSSSGGATSSSAEAGSAGTTATSAATDTGISAMAAAASVKHHGLSKMLHLLFPSQEDIDTIAGAAPARYVVTLFHSAHDVAEGRGESPASLREVPPATSHPAVLARRLLQLTLCMQHMAPCFVLQNKLKAAQSLPDLINHIVTVINLTVTASDDLVGNLEGLQCQILMGQQQSNAGHLRKAWLSYRRALNLAQLMGLDRGNTRTLKSCDPTVDPRKRPTPAALWYRINACDRYVSMLLGLRAGTQDEAGGCGQAVGGGGPAIPSSFGVDTDTPEERLCKAHVVLEGRIIERNSHHDQLPTTEAYALTAAVDADLHAAAARDLAPAWWDLPSFDPSAPPAVLFDNMQRSILQVHHHCILIMLHLPYMLRGDHPAAAAASMARVLAPVPPSDGQGGHEGHDCGAALVYCKATCMQSCRAVLQRFIDFRRMVNLAFSCRHVDYASLIAAMTLIIGYLGPRPAATSPAAVQDAFDCQLQRDRAMVEQVRERMQYIGTTSSDKMAQESAATIQKLLPILDLVAQKAEPALPPPTPSPHPLLDQHVGTTQTAHSHSHTIEGLETIETADSVSYSLASPQASAVRFNVPYFGTVNIHPQAVVSTPVSTMPPHLQQDPPPPSPFGLLSSPGWPSNSVSMTGAAAAGADSTVHDPATADFNAMLVDFDTMPADDASGFSSFGAAAAFPDMTAASDDWVMQGVDTTYWSLLNGGAGFGGPMG